MYFELLFMYIYLLIDATNLPVPFLAWYCTVIAQYKGANFGLKTFEPQGENFSRRIILGGKMYYYPKIKILAKNVNFRNPPWWSYPLEYHAVKIALECKHCSLDETKCSQRNHSTGLYGLPICIILHLLILTGKPIL